MIDHTLLRQIAEECRDWAERKNKRMGMPFSSCLCGMCAIAAAELFKRLTKAGFKARIAANDEHCFVEIVGGLIVDVTATQFKREPVMIIKRRELEQQLDSAWWKPRKRFTSIAALKEWQVEAGWPECQVALAR